MTIRRTAVAGILGLAILVGCGSSGTDISARAQRQLQTRLDEVTAAVALADRVSARSALADLERSVTQLVDAGQLSENRAAEILAAAQEVADRLSLLPAPGPSVTPSPTPTETPTSPAPEKPDKPGKDNGKGKGHH
ncbi:MAG: hypothetical protein ABI635_07205 [Actinomycetota bacterium]